MKPSLTLITLGVDDLDRALRFYRDGLKLQTDGVVGTEFENGAVVFFDLQPGLRLALWPRRSIAADTGLLHFRCWSHTHHLAMMDVIDSNVGEKALGVVKKMCKFFANSSARRQKLRERQAERQPASKPLMPIYSVVTR